MLRLILALSPREVELLLGESRISDTGAKKKKGPQESGMLLRPYGREGNWREQRTATLPNRGSLSHLTAWRHTTVFRRQEDGGS